MIICLRKTNLFALFPDNKIVRFLGFSKTIVICTLCYIICAIYVYVATTFMFTLPPHLYFYFFIALYVRHVFSIVSSVYCAHLISFDLSKLQVRLKYANFDVPSLLLYLHVCHIIFLFFCFSVALCVYHAQLFFVQSIGNIVSYPRISVVCLRNIFPVVFLYLVVVAVKFQL